MAQNKLSSLLRGGVPYSYVRTGEPLYIHYSFYLTNIEYALSGEQITCILYSRISNALEDLASGSGKIIGKIYIGKTFVHKCKRRDFDPLDPSTFTKAGIGSRWNYHKKQDYGQDGMVVVAIVTHTVAANLGYGKFYGKNWVVDTQQCALDIEEALIKKFSDDGRLANDTTYHPGHKEKGNAIGYPIYFTFSYL